MENIPSMICSTFTLLSIASICIAVPTTFANRESCPIKESKIASYDDLPFFEPGPNPIPPHYYGLSYSTFQVDQYDGFISPKSGNQSAMAFGGSGNITIPDGYTSHAYHLPLQLTESTYSPPKQSFDLESFSYACVAGIPQPECAITMWGWKTKGLHIMRIMTFPRLNPGHAVEDFKMNATSFGNEWHGLKSTGFSIARKDNGGDMYGGLALDDVQYTINTAC
jgi:hypothetical protein